MWKYVTRRVKDSVERTYNVYDINIRRTWTCGGQELDQIKTTKPPSLPDSESNEQLENLFLKRVIGDERERTKKPYIKVDDRIFCPFKRRAAARRTAATAVSNVCNVKNKNLVNVCTEQKWDRYGHEQFRKKFSHHRYQCNFQKNVLEALTWVREEINYLYFLMH